MSTLQEVITRAREEWLQDVGAIEWSNGRLVRHGNDAHRWLARRMSRVRNSRWFAHTEEVTLAAASISFDLTSLSKPFASIRSLYHIKTNGPDVKMEPVQEGEENWGTSISDQATSAEVTPWYWLLQTDAATRSVEVRPISLAARKLRFIYTYDPPVLLIGGTVLTPSEYDDLLAAELSRRAFISEGEEDDALVAFIGQRLDDMIEDIVTAHGESSGRRIRDATDGQGDGGWL